MYEKSRNDLNLRTLQKAPRFTLMYECIITSKNGPKNEKMYQDEPNAS